MDFLSKNVLENLYSRFKNMREKCIRDIENIFYIHNTEYDSLDLVC